MDYTKDSTKSLTYEVEFSDADPSLGHGNRR